ncbi:MAG: type II toxin-antitoxin system VapC family toxin [Bacteroidetes bacterium]|nr:type II toxin-antitoxin system VapC family toxin [Bacteroidota bacterium]
MIGGNILLDTNIIIRIFGGDKPLVDKLNSQSVFYIPTIVVGELYVGVNRVTNRNKHLKMLEEFINQGSTLSVDVETSRYYGEIVASLFKKGKPIPTNDIWIASLAKQHQLTLISNDSHFKLIDKLKVKSW